MAEKIIRQEENEKQGEMLIEHEDANWEEECYQYGCKTAREEAIRRLAAIDERLMEQRPKSWKVLGFCERTLMTRFGELRIRRRYYRDDAGNYHFLLDEYLNWPAYRLATPSLTEALVDLSTEMSFQRVSDKTSKLTAGVVSAPTIHRLLQKVTEDAISEEKSEVQSCFEEGKLRSPGAGKASPLYAEADGIHIRLQREKQKHYELKSGIAYEGWERLPQKEERYRLVNKKVYCHSDSSIPFWDGFGVELNKHWDLSYTDYIVLGGDDANWIDKGVSELGLCVRQLDGFHLARSCRKGWEKGKEVYDAIRCGTINHTLGDYGERSGKTAQKERDHVLRCLEKGLDWRKKVTQVPSGARGLGTMESNEDKLFAHRMKKLGMSWTIPGGQRMGKAIQLSFDGELSDWCGREPPNVVKEDIGFSLFDELDGSGNRTAIPALEGPHASRPWVKVLKNLTMSTYPIN